MGYNEQEILFMQYNKKYGKWEDRTSDISVYIPEEHACRIQYHNSENWYYKSYKDIKILQTPCAIEFKNAIVFHNNNSLNNISLILKFYEWYKIFYNNGQTSCYPAHEIRIESDRRNDPGIKELLSYLSEVAKVISTGEEQDFLYKQLQSISVQNNSVLAKAMEHRLGHQDFNDLLIFPFSTNLSQQSAVKIAMEEDLSLIQGPPGTGKTQTILNIVANMIFRGKTVAVVSGNNEATRNVYDKFVKEGYAFLNAFLGRKDNINDFFEVSDDNISIRTYGDTNNVRQDLYQQRSDVQEALHKKLRISEIIQMIGDLEVEKAINDAEYEVKEHRIPKEIEKKHYTSKRLLELSALLECLPEEKIIHFFNRARLLFRFGIIKFKGIKEDRNDIIEYLQNQYYNVKISELEKEKSGCLAFLQDKHMDDVLDKYAEYSKIIFDSVLAERYKKKYRSFTKSNYRRYFNEFVQRYPIVYSTTHSIRSCSGTNYLYDCIIIDESSQVDLITATIAFSCAKKVVLVGDEKQLPHVVKSKLKPYLDAIFSKTSFPEYFDYTKNNILHWIKMQYPDVKTTLLREHYRCDPEIIGFCNKRFYHGELVVVKEHESSCGVTIISHGSHLARERTNTREIEIIDREILPVLNDSSVGIIAPFRNQVTLLQERFKEKGFEIDTIHKFQGKERDCMIMSSVANRIKLSDDEEYIDFVNDPHLINVAISRAVKKLYILASEELLSQEGSLMRDLSKYYEYYCSETKILKSNVYSVFDLMYNDYAPILEDLKKRLLHVSDFMSENIIATVIQDICNSGIYGGLDFYFNYPLKNVIKTTSLTDPNDLKFVRNIHTHCDFVIFSTLDKSIELIVEVDGAQHNDDVQANRDRRKDRLIKEAGLKMLRLPTTSMDCKEKIIEMLRSNS